MSGIQQVILAGGGALYSTANPVMTSNTTPAGYITSASTAYDAPRAAWKARDGDTNPLTPYNRWVSSAPGTQWWQEQFPTVRKISAYLITSYDTSLSPNTWTFAGSNDGVGFTTLDSRSGETAWTGGTPRTFTIASPAPYLYCRITITATNSSEPLMVEIDFTMLAN